MFFSGLVLRIKIQKRWTSLTDYVDFCSVLHGLQIAEYSLCWQHYYLTQPNGTTLPTLTTLKSFGANWLVALYGLVLFLCLISSAVCVIFGFVNRFENVKFLQKVENVPVRRALVSAFIMVVSMGISFVGLTNVVKYGYGYCGYLGIAIIIVPLLTIGFYKNRKFMK